MRTLSAILLSTFALLALACGNPVSKVRDAAQRQKQTNDLKQLGLAIHQFNDAERRTPKSIDELDKPKYGLPADVVSQVRSGKIAVIWGFAMEQSSGKVVAHCATDGNQMLVLLADGSTQLVTNAAFATMAQAVPAMGSRPPETGTGTSPPKVKRKPEEADYQQIFGYLASSFFGKSIRIELLKSVSAEVRQFIEEGAIIVPANLSQDGVWAYEPGADKTGGWLVMNGQCRKMSAEEVRRMFGNNK